MPPAPLPLLVPGARLDWEEFNRDPGSSRWDGVKLIQACAEVTATKQNEKKERRERKNLGK